MIEGKMIQLAGRRAAYLVGIAAIGLSLTLPRIRGRMTRRERQLRQIRARLSMRQHRSAQLWPSTKHLPAGTPLVHWRCWRKTL